MHLNVFLSIRPSISALLLGGVGGRDVLTKKRQRSRVTVAGIKPTMLSMGMSSGPFTNNGDKP